MKHRHTYKKVGRASGGRGQVRYRSWKCTTCGAGKKKETPDGEPPRKGSKVTYTPPE